MGRGDGALARWRGASLGVLAPALVLLIGLTSTATVAQALRANERQRAEELLDREVARLTAEVTAEVDRYRDLAVAARGLFEGSDVVTRADLARFTDSLDLAGRYPGASSISVVVPADARGLAEVLRPGTQREQARELALPNLGDGRHLVLTAARRADRTVPQIGANLGDVPEQAAALRIARDSGLPTLSETYVLLRDRDLPRDRQQLSFVVAAPVYDDPVIPATRRARRASLRGWVLVPIRGGDFLSRTLAGRNPNLEVRLLDGRAEPLAGQALPKPVATLPAEVGAAPATAAGPALDTRHVAVEVVNREWTLEVVPSSGFHVAGRSAASGVAGLSGALVSVLLATLVAAQALGRRRALQQVADATEQLRAANSELAARRDEFAHAALHDPLTGLANRTLLLDRLGHALDRHRRRPSPNAVLFCDLDGFKSINDTRGHDVGDHVLIEVAHRLLACVRPSDTVARLGGDEFVVVCEDLSEEHGTQVVNRIRRAVTQPIPHPGGALEVDVSIGLTFFGDHHADAPAVLREADAAMYEVKTSRQVPARRASTGSREAARSEG